MMEKAGTKESNWVVGGPSSLPCPGACDQGLGEGGEKKTEIGGPVSLPVRGASKGQREPERVLFSGRLGRVIA